MNSTTLIILMVLGCCCLVSLIGLTLAFVYRDKVKTFFNQSSSTGSTSPVVVSPTSNSFPVSDVVPSPSPSVVTKDPKKAKKDKKKK